MSKVELDKIDRKILEVLQTNGRLTNLEVAERVNLSPSPCLRRIRRLEEIGVIRQYAALLEPYKIGLGLLAYINVRLEKQGGTPKGKAPLDLFRAAIQTWPEVAVWPDVPRAAAEWHRRRPPHSGGTWRTCS